MIKNCKTCGKQFIQKLNNQTECLICRKNKVTAKRKERVEAEAAVWAEQKKRNQEKFEQEIIKRSTIRLEDIHPLHALYIIGNGFDLMHRVQSSYYNFRDSLGKRSALRTALEQGLTPDDIWADFEESLGKQDLDLMASSHIVDMWADAYGVFENEDFSETGYYAAIESAANPIITIGSDLQKAFRRWVEKLFVGTDDRPLKDLLDNKGKVLCFNYTEFPETIYGCKDICYIHGCRKNKKEKLILGHRPGMSSGFHEYDKKARNYREAIVKLAQNNVFGLIADYDQELTKNSQEIIGKNRSFFESLSEIDQVTL